MKDWTDLETYKKKLGVRGNPYTHKYAGKTVTVLCGKQRITKASVYIDQITCPKCLTVIKEKL